MTTWFVSRHPGAMDWADQNGIKADRQVAHLDVEQVHRGDIVIGNLPVDLAARVCENGAQYMHLILNVPQHMRGKELTADDLQKLGARLVPYYVGPIRERRA